MVKTPTLTIFANFRINNEERYQRMKNSFMSFKDINAQKWVINVRGSYKLKTILFLKFFSIKLKCLKCRDVFEAIIM